MASAPFPIHDAARTAAALMGTTFHVHTINVYQTVALASLEDALDRIEDALDILNLQGQDTMATVAEVAADLTAKLDAHEAKVDEVVGTLGEIKAALEAALAANDLAGIQAQIDRLPGVTDKLKTAEDAADITPDA